MKSRQILEELSKEISHAYMNNMSVFEHMPMASLHGGVTTDRCTAVGSRSVEAIQAFSPHLELLAQEQAVVRIVVFRYDRHTHL